ncbi:TetR/AcrR family transcriptional regulator [Herbaspirillum sp. B65]|uniref:TetR/AcrR family transcriptional regulator n=1 Tax=Herbaspirillum sp. B65 TaxID=137708 RepID=UPI0005CA65C1|nr:TetR/AcrR family transcriptional regulator [Herbaspirillum sp. B65]
MKKTVDEMLPNDPKPRGRPRSEEAATAVLDAAYRLSAEHGLKGATIQAIAQETGVSKMTIYKWWDKRLDLLLDAFLLQTNKVLAISEDEPPLVALHAHAQRYVVALQGDLGRVMLAVLAECVAQTGTSKIFVERYLIYRRKLYIEVIKRGQKDGSITTKYPTELLYDKIYGTILYRHQFGLKGLDKTSVRLLVDSTLLP